jgi:hypothetical protein
VTGPNGRAGRSNHGLVRLRFKRRVQPRCRIGVSLDILEPHSQHERHIRWQSDLILQEPPHASERRVRDRGYIVLFDHRGTESQDRGRSQIVVLGVIPEEVQPVGETMAFRGLFLGLRSEAPSLEIGEVLGHNLERCTGANWCGQPKPRSSSSATAVFRPCARYRSVYLLKS